jgi:hypothetical protein
MNGQTSNAQERSTVMAKKQSNKIQPVEHVRIGGISAAIWRNEGANGVWFNVTLQRHYRTEEGEWKSTTSFGRDDLLLLAKIADATHTRLLNLLAAERKEEPRPAAA